MNGEWKYHDSTKPTLDKFLDIVRKHENENITNTDNNMWHDLFPERFNKQDKDTEVFTEDVIDLLTPNTRITESIDLSKDEINDIVMNESNASELIQNEDNNEIAEQLLEDFQDDNVDRDHFIEIITSNNFSLICTKLVDISGDTSFKICSYFCDLLLEPKYVQIFCVNFMVPLLKKDLTSRAVENCILLLISKYPLEMCEFVIVHFMTSSCPVNLFVNSNIITDLDVKYKCLLLKLFLNNFSDIHEWSLLIILLLFKSLQDENISDYKMIVKYLRLGSSAFAKNINFGKLLYAVVQKYNNNVELKGELDQIVNENQSAFKTSCANLLMK